MSTDPIIVTESDLPQQVLNAFKKHGSGPKLAMARAAVPMPPVDLLATLCFLIQDTDQEIADTAKETIKTLPKDILKEGIQGTKSAAVLDTLLRAIELDYHLEVALLRNPACDDQTFEFVAQTGKGPILGVVADNQVRYVRTPAIIKALYYNPNSGMVIISKVIENAVRAHADLSIIPGWKQIVDSIMGEGFTDEPVGQEEEKDQIDKQDDKKAPTKTTQVEDTGESLESLLQDALESTDDGEETVDGDENDDNLLRNLLLTAESEEDDETSSEEEGSGKEEKDRSLWMKIEHMNVPQKVRLALVGSAFARSILIHDRRRPVFMAVLESPKLSENEIVSYASDKSLNEELIRRIARNREWIRLYAVKKALVSNPKTPPITAMQLLTHLSKRELQSISKSHDVPGYVARRARDLLQQKQKKN